MRRELRRTLTEPADLCGILGRFSEHGRPRPLNPHIDSGLDLTFGLDSVK
jgi:hypothetical protein